MTPTPEQFLAKLAASPTDAAAFDQCAPGMTRRAHVVATLSAVKATLADNAAMKANLAAKRQKIAALETARSLKTSPKPLMSNSSMPTAAAIAAEIVKAQAAAEAAAKIKTRAQFSELTPQAKSAFLKNGGKLI